MTKAGASVRVHPTVFVAPGAVVLGEVTLGARSSVWFNTVIRGDSAEVVIGEETNLQDNSVVHEDEGLPALIGSRVTVGHRAILHGCVIEDDCLIGMGSIVLSGARVGTGSLVGAGALVREHQSIPPRSLVVGSPARVIGEVADQHRAAIRNGSTHYAELAHYYMSRGLARGVDTLGAIAEPLAAMSRREWGELLGCWKEAMIEGPPTEALSGDVAWDRARLQWVEAALDPQTIPVMEPEPSAPASGATPEAWRGSRLALIARLESLGPREWRCSIGHPTRGVRTLADWVREWVDEDLERQPVARADDRKAPR